MERMVFLFSSWDMRFDPAMVAIALFLVWFVVAAGVTCVVRLLGRSFSRFAAIASEPAEPRFLHDVNEVSCLLTPAEPANHLIQPFIGRSCSG